MHLRDVNGIDVPISVDIVNTTEVLVAGKTLPPGEIKPLMVLTPENAQRIQGMMLARWKGESDLLKGWASQGVKKDQVPQGIRGREAGERMRVKHLQVRVRDSMTCITVLFDNYVPNTVIRYGAAAKLCLKEGRAGQWVTTADGKREYSEAWYQVPLLNTEGYIRLTRACGVQSIAHIETGRKVRGASGDLPDMERGTTRVTCVLNGGRSGECSAQIVRIFLSTPAQLATKQRKVEKEKETLA
jgi:hypothetical protein